jgi:tRNA(Ile)-lysidine synthase
MVLLHLLHELALRHHWRLTVAHLNHQLRGRSSDADERLVRLTAKRLKVRVVVERADVRRFARDRKLSVEMAARELRHEFLARSARQQRALTVALAHHADDQLELFFLRLLRGSGGEGLAGMKWRGPSPADVKVELVRPLLDQPKTMLEGYASERGIRHREDATNALLDLQRNRIRHELLPLLRAKYQPALARTIARVIEIVGADADFAAAAAKDWLGRKSKVQSLKSRVRGPARLGFDELPVAVQRRCVQLQLRERGVEADYEMIEQVRTTPGRPVAIGPRHCAVRDEAGVVLLQSPRQEKFKADFMPVDLKGRAGEVDFGGARIRWLLRSTKLSQRPAARGGLECFDADKVGTAIQLRHWQPGDRFHPIGMPKPLKLQDFFTNEKVPRDLRRRLILAATAGGEVFWVEGMRISERFKLTPRTKHRLQWGWKRV